MRYVTHEAFGGRAVTEGAVHGGWLLAFHKPGMVWCKYGASTAPSADEALRSVLPAMAKAGNSIEVLATRVENGYLTLDMADGSILAVQPRHGHFYPSDWPAHLVESREAQDRLSPGMGLYLWVMQEAA